MAGNAVCLCALDHDRGINRDVVLKRASDRRIEVWPFGVIGLVWSSLVLSCVAGVAFAVVSVTIAPKSRDASLPPAANHFTSLFAFVASLFHLPADARSSLYFSALDNLPTKDTAAPPFADSRPTVISSIPSSTPLFPTLIVAQSWNRSPVFISLHIEHPTR